LKEAKQAVERMQVELKGTAPDALAGQGALDTDELQHLIRAKQKLHAIKYYREKTGVGLKEAKEAVDWLEIQMKQQPYQTR
jgi:ribosomal protein L7/L12